jgi:protein gp37
MSDRSKIEWTESTWNPVTGCTAVSPGCDHCYARRFAERWRGIAGHPYEQGFDMRLWPERLGLPVRWKRPRMIFVNSMSDLFHEAVPNEFIAQVFATMDRSHWHTFQILTKRSRRLAEIAHSLYWPSNVWMGVSIENRDSVCRMNDLLEVPAAVRFISFEPLLGPVGNLNLAGIDWVIVGGENGPHARPMLASWVLDILDRCLVEDVPFFFKAWDRSHHGPKHRLLNGREYNDMPACPGRRAMERSLDSFMSSARVDAAARSRRWRDRFIASREK